MRFIPTPPLLLAALLMAGCTGEPETIVGHWDCATRHPGGFVSSDIFQFAANGQMVLDSDGLQMHGSYSVKESTLTMPLSDVPVPDGTTQQQTLTATITKLSAAELEMSVSTGNDSHLSQCRRK